MSAPVTRDAALVPRMAASEELRARRSYLLSIAATMDRLPADVQAQIADYSKALDVAVMRLGDAIQCCDDGMPTWPGATAIAREMADHHDSLQADAALRIAMHLALRNP